MRDMVSLAHLRERILLPIRANLTGWSRDLQARQQRSVPGGVGSLGRLPSPGAALHRPDDLATECDHGLLKLGCQRLV